MGRYSRAAMAKASSLSRLTAARFKSLGRVWRLILTWFQKETCECSSDVGGRLLRSQT